MKIDREIIPKSFIAFAILIFVLTWIFGVGYITIAILLLLGIFAISLTGFMKLDVSRRSMALALIGYLGISFISLSKFKEDIANWNVDVNMISAGIALLGIAIALNNLYGEKEVKNNPMESTQSNDNNSDISPQGLPSIDVVLDEVRRKLDFQFEQLDGLRTKSGIVMGIAGVIFTLLITNLLGQSNTAINLTLAKIALVPIFASIILSCVPIYIRKWNRPPKLERLRDYYIATGTEYTKLNVIDKCLEAIDENQKLVNKLFRIIKYSYFLLLIGLVLLAVWVGMTIW